MRLYVLIFCKGLQKQIKVLKKKSYLEQITAKLFSVGVISTHAEKQ